jgi:molybdopterin molybdotransferase
VTARPRVRILSPGNELVEPWQAPGPGQIRNGNAYGLAAFVREEGALPELGGIVPDSRAAIRAAIRTAAADGADLILTTGGVSAGDFDFVKVVASEEGDPGWVFRTDMRPGKPLVFARLDGVPLIGLPGNPAAAIVSFVVFVRPLLRKLLGAAPVVPATFPVRFPDELRYKGGRVFLLRCRVEPDEASPTGGFRFAGAGDQDSSFLSSLARANALVRLPAERDGVPAGGVFPAQWLHAVE